MPEQNLTLGTLFTGDPSSAIAAINQVKTAMAGFVGQVSQASTASKNISKAFVGMSAAAKKSSKAYAGFNKQIGKVQGGLERLLAAMKVTASYAAAGTALFGMVNAFRSGVREIVEYDQALKNLQAITRATTSDVNVMDEAMRSVARTTKFSTVEVAEGMTMLGQAGFSAAESVASIQAVANLATGTLSDFRTVTDLMTTTIRAYGLHAAEAGRVSDVMANAINRSKLTIDKLRIAFNYIGASSHQAGVTLEESAAAMMVLANNGLRASTIGTGLRQVLARLLAPNRKLREAFDEAGIALSKVNPATEGFQTALKRLIPILIDSEEGTVNMSKAYDLFGLRGAQAAAVIVQAFNSGDFKRAMELLQEVGTSERMAAMQGKGLEVSLKNLKDSFGLVSIALGEESGFNTSLITAIDSMKYLVDLIETGVRSTLGSLVVRVGAVTTALVALGFAWRTVIALLKLFNKIAVFNPWLRGAAILGAFIGVLSHLAGASDRAMRAQERLAAKYMSSAEGLSLYIDRLEEMKKRMGEAATNSTEYQSIIKRLVSDHGDLVKETDLLTMSLGELVDKLKEVKKEQLTQSLEEETKGFRKVLEDRLRLINEIDRIMSKQPNRPYNFFGEAVEGENRRKAINEAMEVLEGKLNRITIALMKMQDGSEKTFKWTLNYLKAQTKEVAGTRQVQKAVEQLTKRYEQLNAEKKKGPKVRDTSAIRRSYADEIKYLRAMAKFETDIIRKIELERKAAVLAEEQRENTRLDKLLKRYKDHVKYEKEIQAERAQIAKETDTIISKINEQAARKTKEHYLKIKREQVNEALATYRREMQERHAIYAAAEKDDTKIRQDALRTDILILKKNLALLEEYQKSELFITTATVKEKSKIEQKILDVRSDIAKKSAQISAATQKRIIADARKSFNTQRKALEKFSVEWLNLYEKAYREGVIKKEEYEAAKSQIEKKAAEDLGRYRENELEKERQIILDRKEAYLRLGFDRVAVDKWATDELYKINKRYWEKQEGFIAGIRGALYDLEDQYRNLGRTIASISRSWIIDLNNAFTGAISETVSTSIMKMIGKADPTLYKDYWEEQKRQIEGTLDPLYKRQKVLQDEIALLKGKKHLTDAEKKALEKYKKDLGDVEQKIRDQERAMKDAVEAMEKAYDGLGGHLKSIWDKFLDYMIESWAKMLADMVAKWVAVNLWKLIMSGGKSLFSTLFPSLAKGLGGVFEKIKEWWKKFTGQTEEATKKVDDFKKKKEEEIKALRANTEELRKGAKAFRDYGAAAAAASGHIGTVSDDLEDINDEIEGTADGASKGADTIDTVAKGVSVVGATLDDDWTAINDEIEASSQGADAVSQNIDKAKAALQGLAAAASLYAGAKAISEGDYAKGATDTATGAYGAYKAAANAGLVSKSPTLQALGPYVQGIGGAYGVYSGIKAMSEGDYVSGGISTAYGAYNVYQAYQAAQAAYSAATAATAASTASAASGSAAAGAGAAAGGSVAGGAAVGGAYAAAALIATEIVMGMLGKGPGPLGTLLGMGKNPPVPFSRWEEINAWKDNPAALKQYKYSKVYDEEKLTTAFQGIADSWRQSADEMSQIVGSDMAGLFRQDWEHLKANLQELRNTGAENASDMQIKMLDAFYEYKNIAREAESRWASMTDLQRQRTSVMLAKKWENFRDIFSEGVRDMGGAFSEAATNLSTAMKHAISSTSINIRVMDQAPKPMRPDDVPERDKAGWSRIEGRAMGGEVLPGRKYIVGENAPEILEISGGRGQVSQMSSFPSHVRLDLSINGVPTESRILELAEDMVVRYNVKSDNDYRLT